jgi:Putative auto-transporter adhesin, head GIN domain
MLRNLPVFLAILVLAACDVSICTGDCVSAGGDGPTIKGSGTPKTEVRPVDKFTAIRLSVSGNLVIERTGTESLTVTADDNLVSLFTSEVKDSTLDLSVAKGKSLSGKRPVYRVTVSELQKLDVSGSGTVDATKLDGDALSMSISGSGTGNLAGRVDDLTVSISGSGSFNGAELKAKRAKVVVSGSGEVTVNASDELDAKVSGSGSIWYVGSPKLTPSVSGSGSIKKKPI